MKNYSHFAAGHSLFDILRFPVQRNPKNGRRPSQAWTRQTCLFASSALVLTVLLSGSASGNGASPDRPNVVLIMADDLGAECLGCYGGTSFQTPNLDNLARTGLRFTNCYATPLCVPSRMQLMTGRYPFRTGWSKNAWGKDWYFDPAKETSFAQLLRDAGYATCVVDKWMLCYDFQLRPQTFAEAGFDEHFMWRLWDDAIPVQQRVAPNNPITPGVWDAALWKNGPCDAGQGKYAPDLFCRFLIDFIERHQNGPFLAYWPMHLVHLETYHGRTTPPTPDTIGQTPNRDRTGRSTDKQRGMADMIAYMDKLVGRLVSTLDRLGIRENTVILFTGDNGTSEGIRCEVDGRAIPGGKGQLSERGCRVPLIANWLGTTPTGTVREDLIDFSDFLPTLVDAAGAQLPANVTIDGRSFLPQVKGQPGEPREWVYCQLNNRYFIRDQRWMLHSDGQLLDVRNRYTPKPADQSPEAHTARVRLKRAVEQLRSP
jgi:arylsulfatase A